MNASKESNESLNNQQKNPNDIKELFLRNFFKSKNERELIEFADVLYAGKGKISSDVKSKLEDYGRGIDDYKGLNINDIRFNELSSRTSNLYSKVINARDNLKNFIDYNYQIDNTTYKNTLLPIIQNLEVRELRTLGSSRTELDKFISKAYKDTPQNKPVEKFAWDFLADLNIEHKINGLPLPKRKDIVYIIDKSVATPNAVTESDIMTLLGLLNLDENERKRVVEKYFPSISLEGGVKLGIISKAEAKNIRTNFINTTFDSFSLAEEEKEVLSKSLSNEDIYISTKNFSPEATKKIISGSNEFKSNFTSETVKRGEYIKNEYKEGLSRNLKSFQNELNNLGVISAEKFKTGAMVEITLQNKKNSDEVSTYYFEVSDDGSKSGLVNIIDRGKGKYNSSQITLPSEGISYDNFIDFFKKGFYGDSKVAGMQAYTGEEFKNKLKSGEIQEEQESPRFKENDYYDRRIKEIEQKLKQDGFSDEEIEKNEELQTLKGKSEDIDNVEELKIWLDKIDPDGAKFGISKGLTFTNKTNMFYEVSGMSNGEVTLQNLFIKKDTVSISYSDFYSGFKEGKFTRSSNSDKSSQLINSLNTTEGWEGIEIDGGKLVKKEEFDDGHGNKSKNNVIIKYLVTNDPQNGSEVIKILGVSDGSIEVQFGTVKLTKTEVKGEKETHTSYAMESGTYKVSPGFLETWINLHSLKPKSEDPGTKDIATPHDHRQWSLLNWYVRGFSIHNIFQGIHDIQHSMEHYFEGGQKEQAAKAAMKMFNFLPHKKIEFLGEIYASMDSDVEIEQKKRMDAMIEHLGGVDTPKAIKEIMHWLHYSNTPDYKIHAAMMFMIKKYGVLTAKGPLADERGSYPFYKALGGKPNDAFFKKVQKKCEEAEEGKGTPFSEEELVYRYLKDVLAKNGIVRSRLHKEFKELRSEAKKKEYDTGLKDGKDERGIDGRVDFTMGELINGNYPNALGGLQRVYEKGGPSVKLEKVPFIMAFSGICYDFDGKWTLDTLKDFPANGWLSPILKSLSYPSQMDMINETILEITKRMSEIDGKPEIYKKALEIFDQRKGFSKWNYRTKIKKTEAFYDEYGADIISALHMSQDGELGKYRGLIMTEKDDDGLKLDGSKGEGNKVFKRYTNYMEQFTTEFKFETEGVFDDMQNGNGISGLNLYETTTKVLYYVTGGKFRQDKAASFLIPELKKEFEAIGKRKYAQDPQRNRDIQKKHAKKMLRDIVAGMFHNHSGDGSIGRLDLERSQLSFLYKYGLDFKEMYNDFRASTDSIKNGTNEMVESKLEKITNNIVDGSNTAVDFSQSFSTIIQRTKDETRKGANDNLPRSNFNIAA